MLSSKQPVFVRSNRACWKAWFRPSTSSAVLTVRCKIAVTQQVVPEDYGKRTYSSL